jgi:Periplasmic copper-binding protein (NosD)
MTRSLFIAAALALAVTLPAVQAQAQAPRTFVSAAGSDSNPCSFALPCRHFQAAVDATSAGGEVDALDPAGYSPITISRGITIEGQGWSYIAPPPNGAAITINAVSGNVAIHGVSLNGAGVTGGTNGILFNSGGSLTVTDCVMQNFSGFTGLGSAQGHGILMLPTSGVFSFVITNTIVSNNSGFGINYAPTSGSASATGTIDHVVVSNNANGIWINTSLGGGSTKIAVSNSIVSNSNIGIYADNGEGPALLVSIDNSSFTGNGAAGIDAENSSDLEIGRSVITYNNVGVIDHTTPNRVYSYLDNRINSNTTDIADSNLQTHALQ